MVWGCFSYHGLGNLVFIDEKLTGARYVELLKSNLFTSASKLGMENNFVFQQDNDPEHTSKIAQNFFESQRIPVLSWPPQSPDFNPIEHLWDELDRKIPVSMRTNKKVFRQAIEKVWSEIPIETPQNLVKSIPDRLEKCLKNSGGPSGY